MHPGYHIINSLMDTDWYIFTMAQLFLHKHPTAMGRDAFKCRNPKESLFTTKNPSFLTTPTYFNWLEQELDHYCSLTFKEDELQWLNTHSYFKPDFIDWLVDLKPKRRYIKLIRKENTKDDFVNFTIEIRGPITQTIWFEVPVLAMISEIYGNGAIHADEARITGHENLHNNMNLIKKLAPDIKIADFGTRRRHSHAWQEEVITTFAKTCPDNFIGTSNAYFAMKHNLTPIGTMAHKAICAYQQLEGVRPVDSQKAMFQDWSHEYRGDLGIALSDTLGFRKFLEDFDKYFAKLFDGARHDSGDPFVWGHMLIDMYESMNIVPLTKTGIWSDGLTFSNAIDLHMHFENLIQRSFAIGTKFTNDVGYVAPQIVIKLVECNGNPVAKISDDPGKGMCEDEEYVKHFTSIL